MNEKKTRIYTRTGDDGTTGLANGKRTKKSSTRVEALGSLDELNSTIGLVVAFGTPAAVSQCLGEIQHQLFTFGAELAGANECATDSTAISALEKQIDNFDARLRPLQNFILPGGSQAGAACHLARAVCRRAERDLIRLSQSEQVNLLALQYLNRLSDLLFVTARTLNHSSSQPETRWRPRGN